MFEQRHQTVSTAKFVEAMRAAGFNIANKWSGLTISVGLNATSASWKEDNLPPAGDSTVPIQPVTPVAVDPLPVEETEKDEQKTPKGKRTKAK